MILLSLLLAGAVAAPAQDRETVEQLRAAVQNARRLGAGAPQAIKDLRQSTVDAPINAGFQALGAAGKTGKVSGPGLFGGGDGTYAVVRNDPDQMVFDMKTGFVNGRFTLKRDLATGKDLLGFAGQIKDGPMADWKPIAGNYSGQIAYDAGSDSGTIAWTLAGSQVTDTYSGGRTGAMTITLKGNAHTFTPD